MSPDAGEGIFADHEGGVAAQPMGHPGEQLRVLLLNCIRWPLYSVAAVPKHVHVHVHVRVVFGAWDVVVWDVVLGVG